MKDDYVSIRNFKHLYKLLNEYSERKYKFTDNEKIVIKSQFINCAISFRVCGLENFNLLL